MTQPATGLTGDRGVEGRGKYHWLYFGGGGAGNGVSSHRGGRLRSAYRIRGRGLSPKRSRWNSSSDSRVSYWVHCSILLLDFLYFVLDIVLKCSILL